MANLTTAENGMRCEVTREEIRRAQVPHNLFISGLFVLDLFMTPAIVVLNAGMSGLLIPLLCSSLLIGYIFRRSRKTTSWFVDAHWRLTFNNSRWLMLGYAVSALLIFVAWLISQAAHEASMQHILWLALTRIALVPTLIAVIVTAVMEANAIGLANNCGVPDGLAGEGPPRSEA